MLSRSAKAAFFLFMGPAMRVNALIYRRARASRSGTVKVHLGPGQKNYLQGWINVDANMFTGKCDLWTDFSRGLPFPDASVDVFYSHHVIEHFPDSCLPLHFKEMYRCLKPGGVFRVGGPNADMAMRKYT
jgi:predicted SAM-dependent methyltransferase